MKDNELLNIILGYHALGFDITFTKVGFQDGIRMKKRYSYITEEILENKQVFCHEDIDEQRLSRVLQFMYQDINKQEIMCHERKN